MWWSQIQDCIKRLKDKKIDYDDDNICVEWKAICFLDGIVEDKQELINDLKQRQKRDGDYIHALEVKIDDLNAENELLNNRANSYLNRLLNGFKSILKYRIKIVKI